MEKNPRNFGNQNPRKVQRSFFTIKIPLKSNNLKYQIVKSSLQANGGANSRDFGNLYPRNFSNSNHRKVQRSSFDIKIPLKFNNLKHQIVKK